jgi:BON domain
LICRLTVPIGEVTLAGTVDASEARHRAENVAESIAGVVSVIKQSARAPAGGDRYRSARPKSATRVCKIR